MTHHLWVYRFFWQKIFRGRRALAQFKLSRPVCMFPRACATFQLTWKVTRFLQTAGSDWKIPLMSINDQINKHFPLTIFQNFWQFPDFLDNFEIQNFPANFRNFQDSNRRIWFIYGENWLKFGLKLTKRWPCRIVIKKEIDENFMDFDKNMLIWLWIFHLKAVFDMNILLFIHESQLFSNLTFPPFSSNSKILYFLTFSQIPKYFSRTAQNFSFRPNTI